MAHLYPIYLNLEHKKCLVIGGGSVAERKVKTLLEYGAKVSLVSPDIQSGLRQLHDSGAIEWQAASFAPDHLEGVFMAFITTDDHELNGEIAAACRERGIMVNAADDPPNCDFYVPAVLRQDHLAVAISTEGRSPMFAAWLKRELGNIITEDYGRFVNKMGDIRELIKQSDLSLQERRMVFAALINALPLRLTPSQDENFAEERIEHCISCLQD
ncbi:MAG: bifunctional precorrin-2 dehydrogenase/sirohydrochlorin ferrochelatase [Syntrophomonadaceae bacterium]|nr:bifunctional precorrin-2 dehydrogenase/sirohydrochlorin ferrochelatase [Syntrophomonadaceae bacterium]